MLLPLQPIKNKRYAEKIKMMQQVSHWGVTFLIPMHDTKEVAQIQKKRSHVSMPTGASQSLQNT
ncbi:hypothetical protein BJF91_20795 [Allorhizobium taibaishanense]|uniref:Uncharacterized protein n=1 Tax=Allorhizobium taibaishanense TaxID=887144 RepID=A0A1Q9A4K1_9HYPH|nr:hypothetical protein BJF91_20795 [Allorhizobium taibaishanense]